MRAWRLGYGSALLAVAIGAVPAFAQERGTTSGPLFELADGRVTNDPAKAFEEELAATLAGKPPVQSHIDSLRSIFERWAALDPEAAAAAVEGLSKVGDAGRLRETFAEVTGRRWAELDPDAAIGWATRLGDFGIWLGVLASLAATDPGRALTLASGVASGVSPRGGEELVNVVITAIAADDPATAAEHWQDAGLGELSPPTASYIARQWVSRDPTAAETWAVGLPGGDGRDGALAAIVAFGLLDSVHAAQLINQVHADLWRAMAASAWIRRARERRDPTLADFESRLVLSPAARAELDARLSR